MTDNEIIKALECCDGTLGGCEECPNYRNRYRCTIKPDALNLIRNQKAKIEALQMDNAQLQSDVVNANMNSEHTLAEVERLNVELKAMRGAANSYKLHYGNLKSEIIREFADRLKTEKIKPEFPWDDFYVTESAIDDLVKEMTEE